MSHLSQLRRRLTAGVTATGTLAVTLALLAGMPYVLWRATGLPWPEHVSSLSEFGQRLTQPVSDPLMTDLLAVVGWVCWAAFAGTVIREICWYTIHLPQLLRNRHAHDEHVAALSVKGSLAALCIGTLVIALISLWRPQTVSAQQPNSPVEARAHIAATAPLIPAPDQQPTTSAAAATASARATTAGLGPAGTGASGEADAVRYIEYTVMEGDTLWDIAHTHMGDALTWPRIYALNKDRIQGNGARLSDPDLITPGWRLTIPIAQRTTPPPPPAPVPEPAPPTPPAPPAETAPAHPTPHQRTGTGHHSDTDHTRAGTDRTEKSVIRTRDTEQGPAAIGLGEASLIGITAAAGLLAARRYWYWHQNRLRDPGEQERPALSPLVDKAAQAAHAATRPPRPQDPDALVTYRTPPQKPRNTETVTIGVRDDAEVPLNELAVPGGCTWAGPGSEGAARALLTGVLTAAERRRPGPARVTAVVPEDVAESLLPGLPAQFTALTQSADTLQAIRAAEQHLIAHARTQDEQDTAPAATGPATTNSTPEADPGTLLLIAAPDAAHTGQLQALAARSRPGTLIVLTLKTPLPGARLWHIADDGTTTHPQAHDQHPNPLRLFHLMPEAGRDITEVLLTAHGQRPRQRRLPTPRLHPTDERPDNPPAPTAETAPTRPYTAETSRPAQNNPVRVHVFGPITLYARDHLDPVGTNLRSEVHEFLALLAAHPTGLLASDIADKLHLDPGSDQNALKNLRRAVRRALRTATGITAPEFILLQGELHKLHPELVETDLADFSRNLKGAFSASGTQEPQNDALSAVSDALAHYRGPFAQGSDYLWADAIREHLATQATDAVLRLAHQAEHNDVSGEQDAVLTLLEHLGILHPDHERLAQHAIRLYQAAGRHDAARHTYTRLQRHLTDLGLTPEPATQALITPRTPSRQTR
ncbi:BTAD domain-containing putative transcriptional regulator [Streptomyces sp. 35G-GA-8]|uniref:BTAD domain-containing putative transcriptional regulator n=1 Tax=Streptomyces sp. 35G-GA-8 TaxID=2939434 RepID=UPI00201F29D0|nr:BTAD domain-containing putative transcriptional regulator [Streptomyces sp. 35G-GA-8]MCL7377028.1 LysM peptidoglycan-binding domain-containing protein [Streptomyces sp. 35G-GA-8]